MSDALRADRRTTVDREEFERRRRRRTATGAVIDGCSTVGPEPACPVRPAAPAALALAPLAAGAAS